MHLSKLKTFIILSECLNFTEAAERLYCSQPSVSVQIQSLETKLGVPLFDRIGKKLYLTVHGEHFLSYAKQMLNLFEFSQEHIRQLNDLSCGTLSFGASNFVGIYLLPAVLRQFSDAYPNININMNITSSSRLKQSLESNQLEFLILSDQIVIDHNRFQTTIFQQDELVLIVPASHSLASRKRCTLEQLQQEKLIIKPKNSATRRFLDTIFARHAFHYQTYMEISNHEAIKQAVIHGLGVSIVSRRSIQQELSSGLLAQVTIDGVQFQRGIQYVYNRAKSLSPAAKQFIVLLDAA